MTDIVDLQQRCHQLSTLCHTTNRETDWNVFPNVRNKLKTKTKTTKLNFYRKALSSKKSSEVWKVIKFSNQMVNAFESIQMSL